MHFITFGGPYVGERGPIALGRHRLAFRELVARASGRTALAEELARERATLKIKQTTSQTQQEQVGERAKQVTQEPRPQPQPQG